MLSKRASVNGEVKKVNRS